MSNTITLYGSNGSNVHPYTTASEEYQYLGSEGHSAVKESSCYFYEGAAEKPLPSRGMLV